MDTERQLDAHLAQSLDALLSLASLAAAAGRPELALAAAAALDPLAPYLREDQETAFATTDTTQAKGAHDGI